MRGGKHLSLVSPVESKKDWPRPVWVRLGTLSEPRDPEMLRVSAMPQAGVQCRGGDVAQGRGRRDTALFGPGPPNAISGLLPSVLPASQAVPSAATLALQPLSSTFGRRDQLLGGIT